MTRFPELLGIYESMLDMSICRGDLPSAKLAYTAISLFSKDPVGLFSLLLPRAAMTHFSILPEEVLLLDASNIWPIISGMCEASLDKRAYSIATLFLQGNDSSRLTHDFVRWNRSPGSYKQPPPLSTFMDKTLYDVILSMNRRLPDKEYFQFSSIPIGEVPVYSTIKPEYYLGTKSWVATYVVNYLGIILQRPDYEVKNMINLLELHATDKVIQYELDSWEIMKIVIFKGEDNLKNEENLWRTSLRKKVVSLVTEVLETRLPTQEHG